MIDARIRELVEPIAVELGVDVLKVSLGSGGHSQLLRVIVDRTGGVPFEMLERISRGLALQLDAEDVIAGAYRLEVTSPGLDWPLETEADFTRHKGEWIKVAMVDGTSLEGENAGMDGEFLLMRSDDGREDRLAMSEVVKVIRAINWKAVSRKKK